MMAETVPGGQSLNTHHISFTTGPELRMYNPQILQSLKTSFLINLAAKFDLN